LAAPRLLGGLRLLPAEDDCQQNDSFAVPHPTSMKPRLTGLTAAVLVACVLGSSMPVRADDDGDHDRARELYEHGEIRALHDIIRLVAAKVPGEVVSVDLLRKGDRWIYRLQIIQRDGRRSMVDVDARAAEVMRSHDDPP
jgi:uncharacterized membrane protein YkoI